MNLIPWRNKRNGGNLADLSLDSAMQRFRSEMDRMFDRFFGGPLGAWSDRWRVPGGWIPSLDVSETDKHVVVRAEVPGVDPKDVDVTLSGNILTLSGEKKETTERKGESWHETERRFGAFRRSVQLPSYVDTGKVTAEHRNGVLTIQLEKLESASPKRITVTSG